MSNTDPRLEKIINQLLSYSIGNYSVREKTSPLGDEMDAVIIGLNTMGEELQASGKQIKDYQERIEAIMSVLLKYTLLDFSEKAHVGAEGDELDAVAIGLNTMAEELVAAQEMQKAQLKKITEANRFLDAVLENIPNMVFIKDASSLQYVRLNKAGEELMGYPRDKFIGHTDHDFLPKTEADFSVARDRLAIEMKGVTNIPEETIKTAGGEKIVHTKKILILKNGKPGYLLGISEDITEDKKKERELRESKEQIETILGNAPNAVIVMNEKGIITRWNLKAEVIFGWKAEEVIGKMMYEMIMPPLMIEEHKKELAHFLETGEGPFLNKSLELTAIRKNKEEFPMEIGISVIKRGNGYFFISFINDITERKKSQKALRESEERFRLLVEGIQDYAIFLLDSTGHIVNWNKGAEKMKGYTASEIIGKHFSIFYTEDEKKRGRPEHNLKEALKNGRSEDEDWRVKKDGSLFWADVIINPLYDADGNLRGYSKITRDITQRKEAEEKVNELNERLGQNVQQLEAVNKELEAFSYSVSHDLRAPLRAIHGYTKMLQEDYKEKLDDDAITIMDSIAANAKKMGRLIDDLLKFSRLGRSELQKKEVNMTALVEDAVEEVKRASDNIKAEFIIHPILNAMVDPGLMTQVFVNLVSNAVKFSSHKEKPQVEIGCREEKDEIIYYVKDNGAGFDMKYYNKLFGIFQRLHDASEFEGTGVGLALVKRIVARHNGRIWAESELGKGAAFYFALKKNHGENEKEQINKK